MITLKCVMRLAEPGKPWTIGTEDGEGWLFYFDGEILYAGSDVPYEEILERNCHFVYTREKRENVSTCEKRKNWKYIKLPDGVCELEAGLAFIVDGDEDGTI